MKSTNLLNVLINVFYYIILIIGIVFTCIMIYAGIFDDGVGLLIDSATGEIIDDSFEASLTIKDYVKMALNILTMLFFIKTIYHLRIATLKMIKGEMFNHLVSRNLKWTGISMILYKIVSLVLEHYSEIVYHNTFSLDFDFNGFESFIFILILGLFFILLSNVIKNGITLKSENDLTI
jgi:hypothetical protein